MVSFFSVLHISVAEMDFDDGQFMVAVLKLFQGKYISSEYLQLPKTDKSLEL